MNKISYRRHRFPAEIIQRAVWLCFRFPLSYRDVEDLLAERGVDVSYETIRRWSLKFGQAYARKLRQSRPRPDDRWHPDEVFSSINEKRMYLWRAVDSEGEVLDIRTNEASRRLEAIPGVGVITATALVATIGDASQFHSGRQLAAWLGLVPRQYSSGGKARLGRISKRGDGYLLRLLVHGARADLRWSRHRKERRSVWQESLLARRPTNVVLVAMANKTARVVWAMLSRGEALQRCVWWSGALQRTIPIIRTAPGRELPNPTPIATTGWDSWVLATKGGENAWTVRGEP